jgi:Domain of unknown function (DUF4365)
MPMRPPPHETDDQAIASVQKVVSLAGLASEVVHKDYGEDLVVHISIEEQMQPARYWLQVKGTRNLAALRRADGSIAISLAVEHLRRWSLAADPIVIVVWDVIGDQGWWILPADELRPSELAAHRRAQKTLRLPARNHFDAGTATALAWRATLERYNDELDRVELAAARREERTSADVDEQTPTDIWRDVGALTTNVLRLLGVSDEKGYTEEFAEHLTEGFADLRYVEGLAVDGETEADRVRHSTMLALIRLLGDRAADVGLTFDMLMRLSTYITSDILPRIEPIAGIP